MKKIHGAGIIFCIIVGGTLIKQEAMGREAFETFMNEPVTLAETKAIEQRLEAPTVTKEEEAEYKRLAAKNATAKQIFNDIKAFTALLDQVAEFIPKREVQIKDTVFDLTEVKELTKAMIHTVYNVAELGLGIIGIVEEQAPAIKTGVRCLRYSDEELQAAARGEQVDTESKKCAPAGCGTKRGCVARTVKMSATAFRNIFDNAVIKYDVRSNTAQRGFILNVDFVIDWLVRKIMTVPALRNHLTSKKMTVGGKEVTYWQRTEALLKKIDEVRTVLWFVGSTMSGIADALIITCALMDPSSVTPQETERFEEIIREGQQEKITFDEKKLDEIALGDPGSDII